MKYGFFFPKMSLRFEVPASQNLCPPSSPPGLDLSTSPSRHAGDYLLLLAYQHRQLRGHRQQLDGSWMAGSVPQFGRKKEKPTGESFLFVGWTDC